MYGNVSPLIGKLLFLWGVLLAIVLPSAADSSNIEWIRRYATTSPDGSMGLATDGFGGVYVAGATGGHGFLSKYDLSGELQWIHESVASPFTDVIADEAGYVYAASIDASVSKFDRDGNVLWNRRLGSAASALSSQSASGIAADGMGSLYVTGSAIADATSSSLDAYVTKLDIAGNVMWTQRIGTNLKDSGEAIAADRLGNVYVTGSTYGSLGGPHAGSDVIADAFVSRLDPSGHLIWSRQLGGDWHDYGYDAAVDGLGNVYIAGATNSELGGPYVGGFHDAYIAKYDVDGNQVWIRQDGSMRSDEAYGIAVDVSGDIYISGNIDATAYDPSMWFGKTFVTKYDPNGNIYWNRQISGGSGTAISVDRNGTVFVGGRSGKFAELPSMDWEDAFVARLVNLPEPSCMSIAALSIPTIAAFRRRRLAVGGHRRDSCPSFR